MSQSVPFSRMMAFAFSSESSPPDCIWQIVPKLLRATASRRHVGRRDSRWLFQSVTVHPRIQAPLWSPAISGCGADPATVSASRTTRPTCGLTLGWSAKPDATPSNSKGKIYLKGPIVPLEIAKGCHKVLDLASRRGFTRFEVALNA